MLGPNWEPKLELVMRTSSALLVAAIAAIFFTPAQGQTRGGTLRIYNTSQPPSASNSWSVPGAACWLAWPMPLLMAQVWGCPGPGTRLRLRNDRTEPAVHVGLSPRLRLSDIGLA